MTSELAVAFLTGLAGSLHCLGMCGPLVIAYSLQLRPSGAGGTRAPLAAQWTSGLSHHLTFHLGRTLTYGALGALGAGLVHLGGATRELMAARNLMTLAGGILMILLGLALLKVFPLYFESRGSPARKKPVLSRIIRSRPWLMGVGAGFLPCMLSWAMVVKAATMENMFDGFSFMALFGLGTIPVLLFTGLSASLFSLRMRLLGERVAALSVIAMGLILFWKGVSRFV